jgi:hypothetical protein
MQQDQGRRKHVFLPHLTGHLYGNLYGHLYSVQVQPRQVAV